MFFINYNFYQISKMIKPNAAWLGPKTLLQFMIKISMYMLLKLKSASLNFKTERVCQPKKVTFPSILAILLWRAGC